MTTNMANPTRSQIREAGYFRRLSFVQLIIPILQKFRKLLRKGAVLSKSCFAATFPFIQRGASGATAALRAVKYRGFPFMSTLADPPNLLMGAPSNLIWSEIAIFRRMSGSSNIRFNSCKIIEADERSSTRAIGATLPFAPVVGTCLPLMTTSATPPDLLHAAEGNRTRRKLAVLSRMPFINQFRSLCRNTSHEKPPSSMVKGRFNTTKKIPKRRDIAIKLYNYHLLPCFYCVCEGELDQ